MMPSELNKLNHKSSLTLPALHPQSPVGQLSKVNPALLKDHAHKDQVQFAGAVGKTPVNMQAPSKLLKSLDFQEFGQSVINQVKIVYGVIILSRIVAAANRSWNEVRETLVRDGTGYAFWIFTVPMFERLMLYAMDSNYQKGLIHLKPRPEGTGVKASLAKLNHALNPVSRWEVPTSRQIRDRAMQAMSQLEKAGHHPQSPAYKETAAAFKKAADKVNAVKGTGVIVTIAMLGFFLPLLNIAVTRKKVSEGKVGKLAPVPDFQHHHPMPHFSKTQ